MFIFFCCRFIEKLLNCKDLTDYLHLYDVQPVLHHPRIQVSHNDHDIGGKNECVNEACCRNFPRGSEKDINSHTTNPIQFPWRAPDSTLKEILVLLVTNSLPPWRERHQDGTRAGLKRDLGVSRINETLIHASNELNWKVKTSKHQSFIS